jgi:hypothetical protein
MGQSGFLHRKAQEAGKNSRGGGLTDWENGVYLKTVWGLCKPAGRFRGFTVGSAVNKSDPR